MDPLSLVMFGLIAVLIFFMFRNSKKRRQAAEEMQNNLRPGAEVMLQSGIYGVVEAVDEEESRVTVRSGTSSLVVHRNAVGQILSPAEAPLDESASLAPDDDPEFGERFGEIKSEADAQARTEHEVDAADATNETSADDAESDTNSNTDLNGTDENKKP